ncbi:MAG: extracellular solute-binding protein [Desulfurococcus sp.]|nr:extracellular solute-binding protein [Desulfurococcus sp.]
MSQALTKMQALLIIIIIAVAVAAGVILVRQAPPTPTPSPTTTPLPSPTLTTTTTPSPTTTQTTTPTPTPTTTTPSPTTTPTPTTTETTTSPQTTPAENIVVIGGVSIHVPSDFKKFVEDVKAGKTSVTIYFGHALAENERPAFKKVFEMFQQEYPGITIVEIPYATMDQLKTQISAIAALPPEQRSGYVGKVPDIFTWAHDWIGSFADKGYIIPLEDVLGSEVIVSDIAPQFLPIAFSAVTYNLKTYGLPYAGESIALIINKNLVAQPPQTFSEMQEIMKAFTNPSKGTYGLSHQTDPYHLYPFITAFGGYYYDPSTKSIGVNSTGTKEGLKFYISNVLPYLDVSDLSYTYQLNLFLEGKTPMIITGPWAMSQIIKTYNVSGIIVAPIPNIGDRVPKPFSGFRNLYITIMAGVGDKQRLYASVLFVLYMALNDNALKTLVDMNNYVPVKTTMIKYIQENKNKYPIVYGFLSQILRSTPMPNDPVMDIVWGVGTYMNAIFGEYTKALQAGKTVEQAVQDTLSVVDQQLDQAYSDIVSKIKT